MNMALTAKVAGFTGGFHELLSANINIKVTEIKTQFNIFTSFNQAAMKSMGAKAAASDMNLKVSHLVTVAINAKLTLSDGTKVTDVITLGAYVLQQGFTGVDDFITALDNCAMPEDALKIQISAFNEDVILKLASAFNLNMTNLSIALGCVKIISGNIIPQPQNFIAKFFPDADIALSHTLDVIMRKDIEIYNTLLQEIKSVADKGAELNFANLGKMVNDALVRAGEKGAITKSSGAFAPGNISKDTSMIISALIWNACTEYDLFSEQSLLGLSTAMALHDGTVVNLATGGGKTLVSMEEVIWTYLETGDAMQAMMILQSSDVGKLCDTDEKGNVKSKDGAKAKAMLGMAGLKLVNGAALYDAWIHGENSASFKEGKVKVAGKDAKTALVNALSDSKSVVLFDKDSIGHIQNELNRSENMDLSLAFDKQNSCTVDEIDKLLLGTDSFIKSGLGKPVTEIQRGRMKGLMQLLKSSGLTKANEMNPAQLKALAKSGNETTYAYARDAESGRIWVSAA